MTQVVTLRDVTAPRSKNATGKREPLRNMKEVVKLFDFKNEDALWVAVERKEFPAPDTHLPKVMGKGLNMCWKLSTIEREQRRRKNLEKQGEDKCVKA